MRTAVFSIVSPNYLHYARVLMSSAQRHQPDWDRFVLIVGQQPAAVDESELFTAVPLARLALPNRQQFCFRYTILELNTAVKPWMFEYLFEREYERVIYLDPDIVLYSPLVELDALPPDTFMGLTPHLTGSIKGDEHPSERSILQAGTYNLGFLAVWRQPSLPKFLAWWKEKLEFQCVVDTARGLFVDQKWIDLVPGLFPGVVVLRHEGYNVAYWNLGQRSVVFTPAGTRVNGQPLRFFHFSGVDPSEQRVVSRHDRLRLTEVGDAGQLIEEYFAALRAAGYEEWRNAPYSFGRFHDGTPLSDLARVNYRNSTELQLAAGEDPFAHPELFVAMREKPRPGMLQRKAALISYRLLSRVRPLVRLVPRATRKSMREFLLGRKEVSPANSIDHATLPAGLNIVGYLQRDTGVGESARLFQHSCAAANVSTHGIDVDTEGRLLDQAVFRASIYHINADQMFETKQELGHIFEASAYNIGCWHWELPEILDVWIDAASGLNEIWAPSAFIQSAIGSKLAIPVVHMPHGIELTDIEPCSPEELGVPPGRFTFLSMFDLDSVMTRKNPEGAIEAFQRAFPATSSTALLIKVGRAEKHPDEYQALVERLRGVPNIHLSNRMLPRAKVNGLISSCDAILSLHRSEGFGLILAEGMSVGKPVIATGWSGNMDFMNSGNSAPVGYELVTLEKNYLHYQAGQQWAEPDLDHAAHLLRKVVDDAAYRTSMGARAKLTMRAQFSFKAAGARYRRRLSLLGLMQEQRQTLP